MHLSNHPTSRLLRSLAVAVLVASGLVATSGPATAAEPPGLSRLLADCNARTGVSGAVTDASGQPVDGAPVMLHAEPDAIDVGERARLRLLGWTRTDSRGCYAIPLYPTQATLRLTLQRQGSLEIVTTTRPAGGAIHQSFGLQSDRARTEQLKRQARTGVRAGGFLGTISSTASEDIERRVGTSPDKTPFALAGDRPLLRDEMQLLKVYAKRPVLVGQWFSSMKGVTQVWRYARGASTSLSSGFSQTGRAGSFTRNTTMDRSAEATVSFPVARGKAGNYYRSYFRYARYIHWYCDGVACGASGYSIRPYSWERGTQVTSGLRVPSVKRTNCSPYKKGSTDSVQGSKAVTWTNGVSIGGDLAIGLGLNLSMSSQTGFTNSAQNVVTFHKRGFLCGVFDSLSGRPGILVARQFAR